MTVVRTFTEQLDEVKLLQNRLKLFCTSDPFEKTKAVDS